MPRTGRMIMSVAVLCGVLLLSPGRLHAFHQGGVGECEGCHTMHNSLNGFPISNATPIFQPGPSLLKGNDPSAVCLNCHEQANDTGPDGAHVSTQAGSMPTGVPPLQLTPGGDFAWLKKNFTWTPSFGDPLSSSNGYSHGHNIVSTFYGYLTDPSKTIAPGGSFPSRLLGCTSCHDPHGIYRRNLDGSITTSGFSISASGSTVSSPSPTANSSVGVYRLLGGAGYRPRSAQAQAEPFLYNPPAAIAPDVYNRTEAVTQTRVAYGSGMSEWCMNCHPTIHMGGPSSSLVHNAGSTALMSAKFITNYNSYLRTGDLSGQEATSYLSLVPFEISNASYSTLRMIASATPTKGPDALDGRPQVSCLSCHRAHASGWDSAMRWNSKSTYIVYNGKYDQASEIYQPYGQGRSAQEALRAYYDIPAYTFTPLQEKLCYKCHDMIPGAGK